MHRPQIGVEIRGGRDGMRPWRKPKTPAADFLRRDWEHALLPATLTKLLRPGADAPDENQGILKIHIRVELGR